MTSGASPAASAPEAPERATPGELFLSGLRRGAVQVFLPVALGGQAVAWLEYAISGLYHPWSWLKIGMLYALTSVRVGFEATASGFATLKPSDTLEGPMQVAVGALTVAVVVLAFRAGRDQGRAVAKRPAAAALAGAAVGLGFALPMFVGAFVVQLSFPNLGIDALRPVLWQAFVLPLAVGGALGIAGGLSAARETLEASTAGARLASAARGGFTTLWWGLALAFVGFLLLAAIEADVTGGYARSMRDAGSGGAVLITHHALLLPNQSAMILATAMGSPTDLIVGRDTAARMSFDGVRAFGQYRLIVFGFGHRPVTFDWWRWLFLLVPACAVVLGGRRAARGTTRRSEALLRGGLGGLVFAGLAGLVAWTATITLPLLVLFGSSPSLGPDPGRTAAVGAAWGVLGGLVGALVPEPAPPE